MPGSIIRPVLLRLRPAMAIVALATMVSGLAAAGAQERSPDLPEGLKPVREAMEKYSDPLAAIRDGYFSTLGCVEYPDGAMGIHFLNPSLLGPEPDPMKPQVLLYEPDADGQLQLVGVEWFIPLATGVEGHPELFGQSFEGPMEGHYPLLPRELHHYDLHAWIFKANPAGLFHHSNPAVTCEANWPYVLHEEPPPHVAHE